MAELIATAVAVYLALTVLGLCLGRTWRRARDRAEAMNRHPSARSRGQLPLPARYLPTRLGAGACCPDCGWPLLSYEHYTECRR